MNDLPHISWLIEVYDRTEEERFPLKRKWYVFSYDRATEAEAQQVIRLCCKEDDTADCPAPKHINKGIVTFTIGRNDYTDYSILNYRHLFDHVPNYGNGACCDEKPKHSRYCSVKLRSDTYFEDENERPITFLEISDEEGRRKLGEGYKAVVMGVPSSILRFPPAEPVRPELWQPSKLATIDLCIRQFQFIVKSRWFSSRCEVTPSEDNTMHARLPLPEHCMAVILPFRQFYSQNSTDDLFNKACNIHSCHCSRDHATFGWVKNYQKAFNAALDKQVEFLLRDCNLTGRRYLNAFAYGAEIIHPDSKEPQPAKDFNYLCENFPKQMVLMQYHALLHNLMHPVSMIIGALQQNVAHWINDLGWVGSVGPGGSEVFGH